MILMMMTTTTTTMKKNMMMTNGMRHGLILMFCGDFQSRPDDSRSNWMIQASDGL